MKGKIPHLIFDFAIHLENEGYWFYNECAEKTTNEEGKAMFNFLANEESKHKEIIKNLRAKLLDDLDLDNRGIAQITSENIFAVAVKGSEISEKSDALDALNKRMYVEKESIKLYKELAKEDFPDEIKKVFNELAEGEERHLSILESEIESITETGVFREVTS
ncbi:MAG TPA: DUF2202 domain-containing protein [Candidatus Altiarchaeales archaeon]|nr:DUF2202 domain-containing protein [Candidatus Altiarchaeales archaeon]